MVFLFVIKLYILYFISTIARFQNISYFAHICTSWLVINFTSIVSHIITIIAYDANGEEIDSDFTVMSASIYKNYNVPSYEKILYVVL